ncbi:hypothetical protein BOTCAL_0234g00100 [Botryotinia calthae]|uniref:2EXR domain-containing protein n=1 Tax=Botryotinia calthae TaxID=38488 RepID=A0A4Y8CXD7_9HELO|nr:hypothetical protein BOTCAL_0234g00100 [Botryotinia calthae]
MEQSSLYQEYLDWQGLRELTGPVTSTVEEYAQYLSRTISEIPDRWDEKKHDLSDVKFKARDDRVQEKQALLENRLIYCPKTWQISEIKFYHDLPTTPIQIAWPMDYEEIVPILESFILFSKLPTEIRHMIWGFALHCNPRDVKLNVDRKYCRPCKRDPSHVVNLSCHIRQHGPIASKLPIPLLYACQESHLLFMKKYSKMNFSVPVQRCDLKLRVVGLRSNKTVDCEIRIDRKGYMDFRQDTLMMAYFRKVTGILWKWNLTTLDLSMVESIALQHTFRLLNTKTYYGGKRGLWEVLETRCPSLKRLSLIVGRTSMENLEWGSDQQPVARILPINAELVDGVTFGFQNPCQDEYDCATSGHNLELLKIRLRTCVKTLARELRTKIEDAELTKLLYYQEVERNPDYWQKVDVNMAYISWIVSSFYVGEQMEKVIVTPPKDLQIPMPDSYFWAQRPIELLHKKPVLKFGTQGFAVACHPDGSLLNRYVGVKEMFERQD